jgi:pimeloyl-ACP methyl ester carboxylesterase
VRPRPWQATRQAPRSRVERRSHVAAELPLRARQAGDRGALVKLLIALAAGYAGLLALLYLNQERLIFRGTRLPADYRFEFAQRFEEISVSVPGGWLDALHFTQPRPRGLVFFIHGNAGNLASWTTDVDFYRSVDYDLFIFDFRGYGKSAGRIESEEQLFADVRAAWDAIAPRYRDTPVVIFGRSLGTPLAARLAREVHPRLLVLVTPFTSLAAISRRAYPFAPTWLLKYPLRTDAVVAEVGCPILFVHGTDDEVVPRAHSERLRALARAPTDMLVVAGAGHNDIQEFASYREGLAARLSAVALP